MAKDKHENVRESLQGGSLLGSPAPPSCTRRSKELISVQISYPSSNSSPVNRPVSAIPMIGARKLTQLQDNLASSDLALSAEQLKTLEEASRIELGFAMDGYANDFVCAIAYVGLQDKIIV